MEGDAEAAILKSMGVCVRESRSLEQSIIHQQRIRRSEAPPLPLLGIRGNDGGKAGSALLGLPSPEVCFAAMSGRDSSSSSSSSSSASSGDALDLPPAVLSKLLIHTREALRDRIASAGLSSGHDAGGGGSWASDSIGLLVTSVFSLILMFLRGSLSHIRDTLMITPMLVRKRE